MSADLLVIVLVLWGLAALLGLAGRALRLARWLLAAGGVTALVLAIVGLVHPGPALWLPISLAGEAVQYRLDPAASWLLGFGMVPAILASLLGSPGRKPRAWLVGAAMSCAGALGVFGLQQGAAFLIAWELMSLGGAIMVVGDRLGVPGQPVLFMLALLEAGAVALVAALLLLGLPAATTLFAAYPLLAAQASGAFVFFIGLLLIVGFGAKLGLLPFYEWFPQVYGSASGATGSLMSGLVLNAAFFALSRGLVDWLAQGRPAALFALGLVVLAWGVVSALLAVLYAFQQEDWRSLLSFSSAENAAIAVAMLGATLLFRHDGLAALAGLAWTVALLHLAGHALAKGALFLCADAVHSSGGSYAIRQAGWLRRMPWLLGLGALLAAMSLAAIPPVAGFVSEWFVFQTVFQGFHLASLAGRLALAFAGALLALTAAVALATFVKLFGLGLLGNRSERTTPASGNHGGAVGLLGLAVLVLAAGMPLWLPYLSGASLERFATSSPVAMVSGWLLVPLTSSFAFISPSLLVIVMPLLALIPLAMLALSRRGAVRRVPIWYGGLQPPDDRAATTALSFSNALRTFYSFIYRPTAATDREHAGREYFIRRLVFNHHVAPLFGPYLFQPLERLVQRLAQGFGMLQSGRLNVYLALIGAFLILILALTLI